MSIRNRILSRYFPSLWIPIAATFCFQACFQLPNQSLGSASSFSKSTQNGVTQAVSETKVKITVDSHSTQTQTLTAPAAPELKGASVLIAPGTLSVSADLVFEQAANFSETSVASEVGLADDINVEGTSAGIIVRPTENVELKKPLTIAMPLPLGVSLRLQSSEARYGVFYKYFEPSSGRLLSGFKRVDGSSVSIVFDSKSGVDTIVFEGYFGAYWSAILSRDLTNADIPPPASSTEPVLNASMISVIESKGIVRETDIASKQAIPELRWQSVSMSLNADDRSLALSASIVDNAPVTACKAEVFESTTAAQGSSKESGESLSASITPTKTTEHNAYGRFRCYDAEGRITVSPWSDAVAIPAVPEVKSAPIEGISSEPTATPSSPLSADVGADRSTRGPLALDATSTGAKSYAWSKLSGPGGVSFSNSQLEDPTVTATMDGTYVIRLTVTDADANTVSDDMTLVWDTTAPTFAGIKQVLRLASDSEVWLFWDAATDAYDKGLVYDICVNTIPGGCATNFIATYSTDVNTWDYRITGLTAGSSYEFLVRARDAAGNQDSNQVTLKNTSLIGAKSASSALAVGYYHSCALMSDNSVSCWGANDYGQMGDGTDTTRFVPNTVPGLSNVTAIASGGMGVCALLSDTTVKCWGANDNGQIGDGTTTLRRSPTTVSGLTGVQAISMGNSTSCALLSGGSIKCWGWNGQGQLGDGTTNDSSLPLAVSGISDVVHMSAGRFQTCVVRADGTVKCVGTNHTSSNTSTNNPTPVAVNGLTNVAAVSVGEYHACARLTDGTVKCWGVNSDGALGDGSLVDSVAPVPVSGVSGAVALTSGHMFSCATLSNGTVKCWGRNDSGVLGDGSGINQPTAVTVAGLSGVSSTAAGAQHVCARLDDASVKCWGTGSAHGELGNGSRNYSVTPVTLFAVPQANSVVAGDYHSCALLSSGSVKCWGSNSDGQLGDGTKIARSTPVSVGNVTDVTALAAGASHTCALLSDERVKCWGRNNNGALGDGTTSAHLTAVEASGLVDVTAIAASSGNSCAVSNGALHCWGYNANGFLDSSMSNKLSPFEMPGLSGVNSVSLSDVVGCAVRNDHTVVCWGNNGDGLLGIGHTNPSPGLNVVTGLTNVKNIALSDMHGCALHFDNTMSCWGYNSSGQLGNGTTATTFTATPVPNFSDVSSFTVGKYQNTCAIRVDGSVWCWGYHSWGQLGLDTSAPPSPVPLKIPGLSHAKNMAIGWEHSCITLNDGGIRCLGNGKNGNLGPANPLSYTPLGRVIGP